MSLRSASLFFTLVMTVSCTHRQDATATAEETIIQPRRTETQTPTPPSEANPLELSASQEAMARALSHRDAAPACDEVAALSSPEAVLEDLIWLSEHLSHPPWVGIRAANCVIENHGTEAAFVLLGWTLNPELLGLGWLVLDNLDALPQDVAIAIASMAIILTPDIDGTRERISNSENPIISAIATTNSSDESSAP